MCVLGFLLMLGFFKYIMEIKMLHDSRHGIVNLLPSIFRLKTFFYTLKNDFTLFLWRKPKLYIFWVFVGFFFKFTSMVFFKFLLSLILSL